MLNTEIRKKYKSGSAVEIIRNAILAGELSGEIAQNEFADSLGVSRIPVREALIALEYQGLIEKLSNQHIRVINLDGPAIRNLFADMSLLELEAVKALTSEELEHLATSASPAEFHRNLYGKTAPSLRRVFLRTITETYVMFVLEHSDGSRITPAFENLKSSLGDADTLKAAYAVYAEVLADELIRIRREEPAATEEE